MLTIEDGGEDQGWPIEGVGGDQGCPIGGGVETRATLCSYSRPVHLAKLKMQVTRRNTQVSRPQKHHPCKLLGKYLRVKASCYGNLPTVHLHWPSCWGESIFS